MNLIHPVPITYGEPPDAWSRLKTHLGHYDLRVYMTPSAYVDVGAGSLDCVHRLDHRPEGYVGSYGSIGRYNEWALDSRVLVSGAHDNDAPVNISMTGVPLLRMIYPDFAGGVPGGLKPMAPLAIGHNVVISSGARVLPGVAIGDGAVVGAAAVVTRDVAPYAIVAGAPARELRKRPTPQPWWTWSIAYLLANAERLQTLASAPGPHLIQPERPPFVVRLYEPIMACGFVENGQERPLSAAPPQVQAYVAQVFDSPSPYWAADCWDLAASA